MPVGHPLSYDEAARRAEISSQMPLGTRPVRVRRIVGSAGKADKIGANFLPLRKGPAAGNFRAILNKMKQGEDLPPISVYQIGNRYFVIDGHTRVAAAKALGTEFIDADVIEALPKKSGEVNLTHYARKEFERYTGLEGVRLTSPWRYHLLHHHVEGYRLYLERSRGRDVPLTEAARIWYRAQYVPTLGEIRRRKLSSTTGGRTAGDVYTDMLKAWAEEQGLAVSLREMLDRFDVANQRTQSPLAKVRRFVSSAVDAGLPKAVPPLGTQSTSKMAEQDVDAELDEP